MTPLNVLIYGASFVVVLALLIEGASWVYSKIKATVTVEALQTAVIKTALKINAWIAAKAKEVEAVDAEIASLVAKKEALEAEVKKGADFAEKVKAVFEEQK